MKTVLYGEGNKGGQILDIKTKYDKDDMAYNREFQKKYYLSEPDT